MRSKETLVIGGHYLEDGNTWEGADRGFEVEIGAGCATVTIGNRNTCESWFLDLGDVKAVVAILQRSITDAK